MIVFESILDRGASGADDVWDVLDVDWTDLNRRAVRKVTRNGTKVGILLLRDVFLRHGDVLVSRDARRLEINQKLTDVLVTESLAPETQSLLAWTVGNLHLPLQAEQDRLILPADGPTEALLVRSEVSFKREARRFVPVSTVGLPRFERPNDSFEPLNRQK